MRKVWESIKNMKVYVFQYFVWETINFIRNWSTQDKKLETKIKIFNRFPMPRTMKLIPKRPPQQHEAHNPGGFHGKKHGPVWEKYEKDMRNVWDLGASFLLLPRPTIAEQHIAIEKLNCGRLLVQRSINMRNVWEMYEKRMRRLSDVRAGWTVTTEKH